MKSTVYAVCQPTHSIAGETRKAMDLSPAAKFGELNILMPQSQSLLAPVPTIRTLKEKLRNFTDDDYILPVGDPALISTVAMVAAQQNGGRVKFLKWDRHAADYLVIPIDLSGKAV